MELWMLRYRSRPKLRESEIKSKVNKKKAPVSACVSHPLKALALEDELLFLYFRMCSCMRTSFTIRYMGSWWVATASVPVENDQVFLIFFTNLNMIQYFNFVYFYILFYALKLRWLNKKILLGIEYLSTKIKNV